LPRVWARERERERDRERDMTERDAGGVWGGVREWGWGMGVREGVGAVLGDRKISFCLLVK